MHVEKQIFKQDILQKWKSQRRLSPMLSMDIWLGKTLEYRVSVGIMIRETPSNATLDICTASQIWNGPNNHNHNHNQFGVLHACGIIALRFLFRQIDGKMFGRWAYFVFFNFCLFLFLTRNGFYRQGHPVEVKLLFKQSFDHLFLSFLYKTSILLAPSVLLS